MNMREAAEQWVDNHIATCASPTCGCGADQREAMIDALVERWLFDD